MNRREDVCIYCHTDVFLPSVLYEDYVRKAEEVENKECFNGFLRIYSIVRINNCSGHFWHALCLFDFWSNYCASKQSTRGRGKNLFCPLERCQSPWKSWLDIIVLKPFECFAFNGHLVKLSSNLIRRYDEGEELVQDFRIHLCKDNEEAGPSTRKF